jgi:hypothetical protein
MERAILISFQSIIKDYYLCDVVLTYLSFINFVITRSKVWMCISLLAKLVYVSYTSCVKEKKPALGRELFCENFEEK